MYKQGTSDFYIDHLYRHTEIEKTKAVNTFEGRTGLKLKSAFGNWNISGDLIWSEQGDESLKYEVKGYGQLAIMGSAVYFPNTKEKDLYYKSQKIKESVEAFVQVIDLINEEKREALTHIQEQHGKPKTDYCTIMGRIKGIV